MKTTKDFENITKGILMDIFCTNDKTYTGVFDGIKDDRLLLSSLYTPNFQVPFKLTHIVEFKTYNYGNSNLS